MFVLTPARATTLRAVADTFIPAGPTPASLPPGSALVDLAKLTAAVQAQPLSTQAEFGHLLDLLNKPLAGLSWGGPLRPFHRLTPAQRERLLQSWAGSWLPPLRQGFQALRKLCTFLYYGSSPADGALNPAWAVLGYPGPALPLATEAPAASGRPLRPLAPATDTEYTCQVLVIGSGAGGGVVAGELAQAGYDVLVLEAGPYYHGADFTQREVEMMGRLYDARGALSTRDGSISLLASWVTSWATSTSKEST